MYHINKIKAIHGVTVSKSLGLMNGLPKFLNSNGFDCKVITSNGSHVESFKNEEDCDVKIINMAREISLVQDIISLLKLIRYLNSEKPQIVNAGTPKAGLLMMIAAWVTRVPNRIYTIRGLRLETTFGLKRRILYLTEKIAINCSTKTVAISHSLRDTVIDLKLVNPDKVIVLGNGSSNGVNLEPFKRTEILNDKVLNLKRKYNIDDKDFVLGFVGRITKDKGVDQLIEVYLELIKQKENIKLLIVGEFEENDPISDYSKNIIETHPNIIHVGFQSSPAPFYFLMQVLLFLTNREGFGNVSIEAALSGIPVIVKNVTGARDTVLDKETGFIVEDSVNSIVRKVTEIYENESLRSKLGNNGAKWVSENFSQEFVHNKLREFYSKQISL